jgi:hypothetical protein
MKKLNLQFRLVIDFTSFMGTDLGVLLTLPVTERRIAGEQITKRRMIKKWTTEWRINEQRRTNWRIPIKAITTGR